MKKPAKKIGVYVRVSTRDKQTTKSQRHAIREWATANRIQPDQLKWYEDKLSGAKAERPALTGPNADAVRRELNDAQATPVVGESDAQELRETRVGWVAGTGIATEARM